MKSKNIFLTLLITICLFACVDDLSIEPTGPITDPDSGGTGVTYPATFSLATYNTKIASRLTFSSEYTDRYIDSFNKHFYYNYERLTRNHATALNVDFKIPYFDATKFAKSFKISPQPYYTGAVIDFALYPNFTKYFNSAQISILNTYYNNLLKATDATTASSIYTASYNAAYNNTSFTRDQKIGVLGIINVGNEFIKQYFSGKWAGVISDIQSELGIPFTYVGSTSGRGPCTVDVKSVLLGGVVGGASAAVSGAIYGAAGGTVTIPGLGTAAGALGGAVFGFAIGFTGGVVQGVVTDVLKNCLFANHTTTLPFYMCDDIDYMPEGCLVEVNDNKLFYIFAI